MKTDPVWMKVEMKKKMKRKKETKRKKKTKKKYQHRQRQQIGEGGYVGGLRKMMCKERR